MQIIKRDGRKVDFDKEKIKVAVLKAFIDVDGEETSYAKDKAREIASYIEAYCEGAENSGDGYGLMCVFVTKENL